MPRIAVEFDVAWNDDGDGGAYIPAPEDCPLGCGPYGSDRYCLQEDWLVCPYLAGPARTTEITWEATQQPQGLRCSVVDYKGTTVVCNHPAREDDGDAARD